jgi:hypothetical protein
MKTPSTASARNQLLKMVTTITEKQHYKVHFLVHDKRVFE